MLGGSSGGLTWCQEMAGLLACQGYCTLALAYFGLEHLPSHLERIPLEYLGVGLAWLAAQPEVDSARLGACGHSRGAELALLLASKYPQLRAVVALSPSGIVWAAPPPRQGAAWTWQGSDVPYAEVMSYEAWDQAVAAGCAKADSLDWYLIPLRNAAYREATSIRMEDICGSVLMVSGMDDRVWPSQELADFAVRRCNATNFRHSIEHVAYEGLGHLMGWPYWPTLASRKHPVSGEIQEFGGQPELAARARLDSWNLALQFLEKRL